MKTYEITIEGKTLSDIEDGIREALKSISTGCVCGMNGGEGGEYSFSSTGEFEPEEEDSETIAP